MKSPEILVKSRISGLFLFMNHNVAKTLPRGCFETPPPLCRKAFLRFWHYSHSLKLALYGVNLGLSRVFYKEFDRLFPLRLWSLRKNGIKMVSLIPPGKHGFPTVSLYHKIRINTRGLQSFFISLQYCYNIERRHPIRCRLSLL